MKTLKSQPDFTEDEAWKEITRGIKKISRSEPPSSKPLIIKEVKPHINMSEVYKGNALNSLKLDITDNIDNNTAKRFKREEFPIEATLDLHGYTEDQAYNKVFDFVRTSYIRQKRCILIITGKGLQKKDDDNIFATKGVLKERVPQWLNSSELRPLILSFRHPTAKNGGEGALYILLRRKR